jgi:hypothetical protein
MKQIPKRREEKNNMRPASKLIVLHGLLPLKLRSAMMKKFLISILVSVLLVQIGGCLISSLLSVQTQAQPPPAKKPVKKYSTIPTNDSKPYYITNGTFWKWIKGNFTDKSGTATYKDMIFEFDQCSGGGFVKSLPVDLKNAIAMSASDYGKDSYVHTGVASPPYPKGSYGAFLEALTDVLKANSGWTVDQIFSDARRLDTSGPKERNEETPQISNEGKNKMTFGDGKTNIALLYAGRPDLASWNDLDKMYGVLKGKYDDIRVLYGDGTGMKPDGKTDTVVNWAADGSNRASMANLQKAIIDIGKKMGSNKDETFLFWVSDHGDSDLTVSGQQVVDAHGISTFKFDTDPTYINEVSKSVSLPSVEIPQWNVTGYNDSVLIDGAYVGSLEPTSPLTRLYFGKDQIPFTQFNNTFTIQSNQSTAFTVGNITLYSGEVPMQTANVTVPFGPTADFTESNNTPTVGERVTFNPSLSEPGSNNTNICPITMYTWNFGDNTPTIITPYPQNATHTYTKIGEYNVTLTVTALEALPENDTYWETIDVVGGPVGGIAVPVGEFGLLGPYIGLTSTLAIAAVTTAACIKRVKRGKEKRVSEINTEDNRGAK